MLQSMLFDVMFLNRYGGDGATADTRMDQHLLATAVPHFIPAKPRKVCTLSPSLMTVNVVVCAYILHLHFCDVMMSLQVM